jgi:cell division septal protein FtsQ
VLIWFFVSNRFYINQIVVEGNQRVSAEAIVAASGIQGYSIFWVNARQVAESVVQSLPPVKHVQVQYGLPNVVTLTVKEQGEQVMWMVAGQRYWVDEGGMFYSAQGGDDPRLLVRDIRPGLPSSVDTRAVIAARQLVSLLPELTVVDYAPRTGLQFAHPLGWVVYLGTGDDMAHKVGVLRAIEQRLSQDGVRQPSLVDVRYPDTPYYRYPGGESGG